MKTWVWIIICVFCIGIGAGGYAVIDYKFFPCPKGEDLNIDSGPEQPTIPRDGVTIKPGQYAGGDLHIKGDKKDDHTVIMTAWNDLVTTHREFYLDYTCPVIPKWTLQFSIMGGAGYMKELNKFDGILGGEAALFRHFGKFAVGGGLWYMQGVATEMKSGGAKASLLFSWGKQ